MAYNEKLTDRAREIIAAKFSNIEEKKAFGGLCFMVNDKMCVGIKADKIMLRINPDCFDEVVQQDGCTPMIHNGKTMKGFLFVSDEMLKSKKELENWVNMALDFNEFAKSSKKKKSK